MPYTPNPEALKHYTYGKYKIDFYKNTAIINWTNTVDKDYDEKTSYKATKAAILDRLNNNEVFDTNFILINEEYDKKEFLELYIKFKENLTTKDRKAEIRRFLEMLLFENSSGLGRVLKNAFKSSEMNSGKEWNNAIKPHIQRLD